MKKKMNAAERTAVEFYTGPAYSNINKTLRSGSMPDWPFEWKVLDAAITACKLRAPMTLFRGVGEDFAIMLEDLEIRVGNTITDRGYMSASRSYDVALRYAEEQDGGMVMRIRVPIGAHCRDLSEYSNYPDEEEVLLPRGSELRVLGYNDDLDLLDMELLHAARA